MEPELLIEISPAPTTVVQVLENHPERWTKGAMFRNGDIQTNKSKATCACLGGLINLVYGANNYHILEKVTPLLPDSNRAIPSYNDDRSTTHADILALAKKAGI